MSETQRVIDQPPKKELKKYGLAASGHAIVGTPQDHVSNHMDVFTFVEPLLSKFYFIPKEEASMISEDELEKLKKEGNIVIVDTGENNAITITLEQPNQVGFIQVVETTEEEEKQGMIVSRTRPDRNFNSRFVSGRKAEPTNKITVHCYRKPVSPGGTLPDYGLSTVYFGPPAVREPAAFKEEYRVDTNPEYVAAVSYWKNHAFVLPEEHKQS